MEFTQWDHRYLDDCVVLAHNQYREEQKSVPALSDKNYEKELRQSLTHLFEIGTGTLAFDRGQLVGYLAFGSAWGNPNESKQISSPLWGYGIAQGCDRRKVVSLLFQHASETLCKSGVGHYSITVYAHDTDVIASYVVNNFGILCTDTIRMLDLPAGEEQMGLYRYEELPIETRMDHAEGLLELWHSLVRHLRQSPTYYPGEEFTDDLYLNYIQEKDTRVFVARDNEDKGKMIGMIDVSTGGNSFITSENDTRNVGDLYVELKYRGQAVSHGLMRYVISTLQAEGVKRLWVEHGTTNPTAQRFWSKYFQSFTYTLTRSIDGKMLK